jgi:hypothetical protein
MPHNRVRVRVSMGNSSPARLEEVGGCFLLVFMAVGDRWRRGGGGTTSIASDERGRRSGRTAMTTEGHVTSSTQSCATCRALGPPFSVCFLLVFMAVGPQP